MNALSKLFEVLHLSRGEMTLRKSHRRRRARRQGSALSCETLEPKQLLAADVAVQFSDIVVDTTDPVTVALEGTFEDTAVSNTVVKFETNAPLTDNDFYVELTSNTPLTNANFLSYVNSGAYDNSEFHRSVSDFVLQGGGFKHPTVSADQPGSDPVAIVTTGTVQNEPGNLNTRGTIAMAKLGGQPDSATSQFFFNLSENSFLDSDNGGYTQFGSVLGSGMTVVDTMGSTLTYDAQTYYSNTAFSDLPLWNINQDNIVQPQDFVQIENADVVTESDLMTYQVSSSDAAKLTASFDGNGDLVLTPNASASGSVTVTVTATSKIDNSTASDTFSVQLNGGGPVDPGPTLTAIETAGSTTLNRDDSGNLYAGSDAIYLGASQLTVTTLAGYTPKAVEDFGETGGKQLVLKNTNGLVITWQMNDVWSRVSNLTNVLPTLPEAFNNKEAAFGVDLDDDSDIGLTEVEQNGIVSLKKDTEGKLFAGNDPIYLGASQLTVTTLPGYTPVAVEDFGETGGKQLVLKHTSSFLVTWQLTSDWQRESNLDYVPFYNRTNLNTVELSFGIDADDDGIAGFETPDNFIDIETAGNTSLQKDDSNFIYASGLPLFLGRTRMTTTTLASYTPMAVEDFGEAGGKQLVLKNTNGLVVTWQMNDAWSRTSNLANVYPELPEALNAKEVEFGVDLDGDADVGLTELEENGVVSLKKDTTGKLYAGSEAIYLGASQLTVTTLSGYTPVAVEDFGETGGKQLVLKNTNGLVVTWQMNDVWSRVSNLTNVLPTLPEAFNNKEAAFGVDLDDDSDIGLTELEENGVVSLKKDTTGKLYAGSEAIYLGASQLTVTTLSGYTPVAVEDFGETGGKQLVLKNTNGLVITWQMNDVWSRVSNLTNVLPTLPEAFNNKEAAFGVDLDDDSDIGLTEVEQNGIVSLKKDTEGKLFAGNDPIYLGASQLTVTTLPGYTPVAVEDFGETGGKQLVLKHTSSFLVTWQLTSDWQRESNLDYVPFYNRTNLNTVELSFGIDADDDGIAGFETPDNFIDIETAGNTSLQKDDSNFIYASGLPLFLGRTRMTTTTLASYTPMAVEDFGEAGGKQLVLKNTNGLVVTWQMNDAWSRTSNLANVVPQTEAFNNKETQFGVDLDDDSDIGS